ncbi:thymidine phosphorylase [Myxococcota bacterium]|nr:thymidine phosphorylase [Myxococcota bacterium]MBU1380118.1 thymidine phosphorylase [Myxococcota bacterium]MBU1497144.1 thymidine phosphorylase [Myxococcota bacterium]
MIFQDVIIKKREGLELTPEEIHYFVREYSEGRLPDYQASALLMAIFIKGLSGSELTALTQEMLHSGDVVDLSHINGVKVDKHSTGGVGDKISIPLAPIVAACGVYVPMISGRGLGHTGGTLDKLESIPGFNVNIPMDKFKEIVEKTGVCLIGQTSQLAPADKKIYALRDATGTVPSIPLISSSIMSKKLAEGIDALVLDVKTGSGAFMKSLEDARTLATTLADIGYRSGKKVTAFITRMDDPLGIAVGNSSEIIESIEVLKGRGPEDIKELTFKIACEMLILGNKATNEKEAMDLVNRSISDGSALSKFAEIIKVQNGNPAILDNYKLMPGYTHTVEVKSTSDGWVSSINSTEIGMAGIEICAGRKVVTDTVDHGAGIDVLIKSGTMVKAGDVLALINHNGNGNIEEAIRRTKSAYIISENAPGKVPLIIEEIRRQDTN